MKSRSLNDTRFITKYLKNIIEQFLEVDGKVSFYNAKSVNILKKTYGLNRLTHSLENEKYRSYDLFRYNNYEINDKDKTITFNFINKESKITKTIKIAAIKEKDNSPEYIKKYNISFLKVLENTDVLADILEIAEYNYTAYDLLNKVVEYPLPSDIKESFIEIFNKLHIEFDKTQIKNRDNHLHHALDAVVTAAMTNSLLVKITKFYQKIEDLKNQFYLDGRIKIEETGEDISSKDELNNYIENLWKNKYILPYEKFIEEVKYRIYEVDKEAQREKFSCEFNDGLFRNIRPITPVRFSKRKETGRLHKETIYGITNDEQTLTQRISVLKLDNKKLEKMLDKDNRAKMTYEAVKKWLNKKETEFPQLPNGRKIKKITINAGDATKAIKVKHGYASIDDVLRTDVYKSKNKEDNKLYFVQRQAFNLAQEKRGEKDFKITLWWGRDKNHKIMPFSELVDYELVSKLYKNDLVYVETKNGKGYGYVVGFSSGMFEVGSVIGDGYDLVKSQNSLFTNHRSQYQITISTIEKIQKIKINMLGELSDQV